MKNLQLCESNPSDSIIVNTLRKQTTSLSHEQELALRDYAQTVLAELMDLLEHCGKRLRAEETDVCLLLRLDFPLKQIVRLMNASYQSLYMTRKRLMKKVFGCEGSARDFDERIKKVGLKSHFV